MTPCLPLLVVVLSASTDNTRLTTTDLPAYRKALEASEQEVKPVRFRDLWDHPELYQGHRVEVHGVVVRRFAQPAFGAFPPLTELWLRTPGDNPICLVYPTSEREERSTARPGQSVAFTGTFLRRLRYEGGDGPRLAPLVVGGSPPRLLRPPAKEVGSVQLPSWLYWTAGVSVVASLALLMAWLQIQARTPTSRPPRGATNFLEEDDANAKNGDGATSS